LRPFALALCSLLLAPLAAHADTFNISVTANGTTYSGSISGNDTGSGYLITSVSSPSLAAFPGTVSVADPANSIFGADDLFFPTELSRLFDVNGLEIFGSFGTANLYLFNGGPGYSIQGYDASGDYFNLPATVSLAAASTSTPEPSSIVLALTGLAGAAATAVRRRKALLA
jgi:hypothetical protein